MCVYCCYPQVSGNQVHIVRRTEINIQEKIVRQVGYLQGLSVLSSLLYRAFRRITLIIHQQMHYTKFHIKKLKIAPTCFWLWCASCVTHDAHHSQTHSQQRTLTQHDMLPHLPVNIMELFCECFKNDFSKEKRNSLRMILGSTHVWPILSVLMWNFI